VQFLTRVLGERLKRRLPAAFPTSMSVPIKSFRYAGFVRTKPEARIVHSCTILAHIRVRFSTRVWFHQTRKHIAFPASVPGLIMAEVHGSNSAVNFGASLPATNVAYVRLLLPSVAVLRSRICNGTPDENRGCFLLCCSLRYGRPVCTVKQVLSSFPFNKEVQFLPTSVSDVQLEMISSSKARKSR